MYPESPNNSNSSNDDINLRQSWYYNTISNNNRSLTGSLTHSLTHSFTAWHATLINVIPINHPDRQSNRNTYYTCTLYLLTWLDNDNRLPQLSQNNNQMSKLPENESQMSKLPENESQMPKLSENDSQMHNLSENDSWIPKLWNNDSQIPKNCRLVIYKLTPSVDKQTDRQTDRHTYIAVTSHC